MAEIFEDVKDMGVLIGKGGVYGQVTALIFHFSSLPVFFARLGGGINTSGTSKIQRLLTPNTVKK